MQTRLQSFTESLVNILIGYFTALISQILVFPLFNIYISICDNLLIYDNRIRTLTHEKIATAHHKHNLI